MIKHAAINRRGFLAVLTAPLIVQPTLEEMDRLTWKRRFFTGYSPLGSQNLSILVAHYDDLVDAYMRPALVAVAESIERHLLREFAAGRLVHRDYESDFHSPERQRYSDALETVSTIQRDLHLR